MALLLTIDHRKKLLENARTYLTAAERFLRCCKYVDLSQNLPVPDVQEDIATWRGVITFTSGHVLRFRDIYRTLEDDLVERVASFDFREEHSDSVIFRIDAHGGFVLNGDKFHLDLEVPAKITYEDGDPRLKGYSLSNFTMVDMIYLITLHLEGEALPWE